MSPRALPFTLVILAVCGAVFADTGHVQIIADPGISVVLDGESKGLTTEAAGGMILSDLPVGEHRISLLKDGSELRAVVLTVKKDAVVLLNLRILPTVEVRQVGGQRVIDPNVGTLVLQTIPLECSVEVPAFNIKGDRPEAKKIADQWTAMDVPVGKYQLKVAALDKNVSCEFAIEKGQTTRLLIDIIKGTVRDLGEEARRPSTFLFVLHGVYAGKSIHAIDRRGWSVKILDGEKVLWEKSIPTKDVAPEEYLTFRDQAGDIPVKTITLVARQHYQERRADQEGGVVGDAPDAKVAIEVPANKIVAIAERKAIGGAPQSRNIGLGDSVGPHTTQYQGLEMKIFDKDQQEEAQKWCEQADSDRTARRLTDAGGN